jgi:hypothetical protein
MPTKYDHELIEELLSAAKERQTLYWDALGELESALDCEIDGATIGTHDVDSLIALADGGMSDGEETGDDPRSD